MREYLMAVLNINNQKGQTMVELALILVLISIVAIATMTTIGQNIVTKFGEIAAAL
ncbi:MAG: Flp/Fap pilin component [Firmicutes bacterium]|nr:Flp/Fap pilin component [Bacillota bacterium]